MMNLKCIFILQFAVKI
ncbi:hypothetical protein Gotur_007807 [Gossypium turneri]